VALGQHGKFRESVREFVRQILCAVLIVLLHLSRPTRIDRQSPTVMRAHSSFSHCQST
jgi:hypothetical protein